MTRPRTGKIKGASFEYDCQESLQPKYKDIYLTKQRGFQLQYDLRSDLQKTVFECKRLKAISWNELIKIYKKLANVAPTYDIVAYKGLKRRRYWCFVLFKSNYQPCLVFDGRKISTFEDLFVIPFKKHTPIKRKY